MSKSTFDFWEFIRSFTISISFKAFKAFKANGAKVKQKNRLTKVQRRNIRQTKGKIDKQNIRLINDY